MSFMDPDHDKIINRALHLFFLWDHVCNYNDIIIAAVRYIRWSWLWSYSKINYFIILCNCFRNPYHFKNKNRKRYYGSVISGIKSSSCTNETMIIQLNSQTVNKEFEWSIECSYTCWKFGIPIFSYRLDLLPKRCEHIERIIVHFMSVTLMNYLYNNSLTPFCAM